MKYWKIMQENAMLIVRDKKAVCVRHIPAIEGELFTKKELLRLGVIGIKYRNRAYKPLKIIEISSHKTYFSVGGCRFQERDD